jgi:hypothetical protein
MLRTLHIPGPSPKLSACDEVSDERGNTMKIKNRPVIDPKKPLAIKITTADVKAGQEKDADNCAAAVALCRQLHCDEAKVHLSRTYIRKGATWQRYLTPPALRREIVAFDRGGAFMPGEYTLLPVQPSQLPGVRDKRAPRSPERWPKKYNKPKYAKVHLTAGIRERMGGYDL